jgi:hypothetical protein
MKSSLKISLAIAAGAVGTLTAVTLADWRPFVGSATEQALQRRVSDLEHQLNRTRVMTIGANGGGD